MRRSRRHAEVMRRTVTILSVTAALVVGALETSVGSTAAAGAAPPCSARAVRISDYNTIVGTGNVNDLFWVRNIASTSCSLRGYVRVAYVGVYGIATPHKNPHRLTVREVRSYGRDGNDLGGLKKGLSVPTVTLEAHGGVASFWLYGTDEPHNDPPTRCITSYTMLAWLPGSSSSITVQPRRNNGFFWCGGFAAHPIVEGRSGSDPPVALSYYFGTGSP